VYEKTCLPACGRFIHSGGGVDACPVACKYAGYAPTIVGTSILCVQCTPGTYCLPDTPIAYYWSVSPCARSVVPNIPSGIRLLPPSSHAWFRLLQLALLVMYALPFCCVPLSVAYCHFCGSWRFQRPPHSPTAPPLCPPAPPRESHASHAILSLSVATRAASATPRSRPPSSVPVPARPLL